MERFFRKNQGSISVLLAIIMLPTILFSGVLIDVSNRQMSKAMVESAGELAMNSALSQYDAVLEDVYGLFAISQDYNDLKKNVEQYMKDTLDASGILAGTDYGSQLVNGAMSLIDSEVGDLGNNFIQAKVTVSKAEGLASSSLSQPQIIKNQIVEHMKYRGIEVVAQDLLSTLKQFKGMSSKTTVADKKTEVADCQETLSNAAQTFYKELVKMDENLGQVIAQYQDLQTKNKWGPVSTVLVDPYSGQWTVYTAVGNDTVFSNLWNANYNIIIAANAVDLDRESTYFIATHPSEYIDTSGTSISVEGNKLPVYLVRDLRQKESDGTYKIIESSYLEKKADKAQKRLADLLVELNAEKDAIQKTGIHYFVMDQMTGMAIPDELSYSNYSSFMYHLVDYTSQLRYAKKVVDEYDEKESLTDDETTDRNSWNDVLLGYSNSLYNILRQMDTENKYSVGEHSGEYTGYAPMAKSYLEDVEKTKNNIGKFTAKAFNIINPYYTAVHNALHASANKTIWQKLWDTNGNYFDYLLKLGNEVKKAVKELRETNDEYGQAINDYKKENGSDDYSAQMGSDQKSNNEIFTEADVEEILVQLRAIKSFLEKEENDIQNGKIYKEGIDVSKQYGEKDYNSLGKKYLNGAKSTVSDAMLIYKGKTLSEITNITYYSNISVKISNTPFSTNAYAKKISQRLDFDGNTIPVPKFYLYLAQTYPLDDKDKDSGPKENMDKAGEKEAKETSTDSVEIPDDAFANLDLSFGNKESGESANRKSKILEQFRAFGEIFRGLVDACKDIAHPENIRDSLLVTTYIYENFSNFMDSEKPSDRETLTHMKFSADNNVLFGCETEYILYGDHDDPQSNVQVVKGNIFAIRFIANCIFAICDGTINAYTLSPALAIQAATLGVFPYKVAQIILDIILGLCETIYDVETIMDGGEVPLFKSIQTWVCQPSGVAKILEDAANKLISEAADTLSDKLQNLVNNKVDDISGSIIETAKDITDDAASTLKGYIKEAVGTLSQLIASELTGILNKVYTGNAPDDIGSEYVSGQLKQALRNYINEAKSGANKTLSPQVAEFLEKHVDTMVNKVMNANATVDGKKITISSLIDKVNKQYKDLITTGEAGTIEVNPDYFKGLFEGVSKSLTDYLDDIKDEIDDKVTEWTKGFADEIKNTLNDYIDETTHKLSAQASEAVTSLIDEKIGSYFPAESSVGFDNAGTASSGTLKNMFNFGYTDYLRLFLFLCVSNNKKESAMLSRVGDCITMNRVKGLKDYYAANSGTKAPAGNSESNGTVTSGYSMTRAYTYIIVTAEVKVKPVILGSTWFSSDGAALKDASDTITGSNFWSYEYATTGGY